jgi:hypothetical protein
MAAVVFRYTIYIKLLKYYVVLTTKYNKAHCTLHCLCLCLWLHVQSVVHVVYNDIYKIQPRPQAVQSILTDVGRSVSEVDDGKCLCLCIVCCVCVSCECVCLCVVFVGTCFCVCVFECVSLLTVPLLCGRMPLHCMNTSRRFVIVHFYTPPSVETSKKTQRRMIMCSVSFNKHKLFKRAHTLCLCCDCVRS